MMRRPFSLLSIPSYCFLLETGNRMCKLTLSPLAPFTCGSDRDLGSMGTTELGGRGEMK